MMTEGVVFPATRALERRAEMSAEVADIRRQPRPLGEGREAQICLGSRGEDGGWPEGLTSWARINTSLITSHSFIL